MTEYTTLDAARDYFKMGWSVIPLRPAGLDDEENELAKRPSLATWTPNQHKAWGLREINDWWSNHPDHNIGIVTGKVSGISVVDVDGDGGKKALKDAGLQLPATRMHKTPHGWHFIYAYDPKFKQGQGLLDHVDVRNDGGYIVVPPTVVTDGTGYTILHDVPIAKIAVPEMLQKQAKDEAQAKAVNKERTLRPQWASQLLANPPAEPGRNASAARIAGYFHRQGVPTDVIFEILSPWAEKCSPPFPQDELIQVVESVTRYDNTLLFQGEMIAEPTVTVLPSGRMRFDWELEKMTFDLERIRMEGARIPCLMTVSKNGDNFYGPATFDLYSSSARRTARSDMGDEAPWGGYFNWMANRVRQEYDKPHAVTELSRHKVQSDSPWLVEPFLRRGLPGLLFGSGGIGKSTLALALCLSLARGKSIIPGLHVDKPVNSLYLDWEQETDDAAEVLQSLASAANVSADGVLHMRMAGSLTDHLEHILGIIQEHKIGFVVVDSILPASGNDIKDDESPRLFYQALRETGAATLCLTHHSKAEPDQPYGNVYWTNLARGSWKMEGEQDPESNVLHSELFNVKMNRGGKSKPFALDTVFDDSGIGYKTADIQSESMTATTQSAKYKIRDLLLSAGAMEAKEVSDHFGISPSRATNLLKDSTDKEGQMFIQVGSSRPAKWGAVDRFHPSEFTGDKGVNSRGDIRKTYITPQVGDPHSAVPDEEKIDKRLPWNEEPSRWDLKEE